VTTP
jgi:choline-glycine betaine transporter